MSDGVFKAPRTRRQEQPDDLQLQLGNNSSVMPKRRRTAEDFFSFCSFILEYENYEAEKQKEMRQSNGNADIKSENEGKTVPSSNDWASHSSGHMTPDERNRTSPDDVKKEEDDRESWDLVTCFCLKPFAGRPMIECSQCLTWIHLSCAKIRRNNIPDEFVCHRCKEDKVLSRRAQKANAPAGDRYQRPNGEKWVGGSGSSTGDSSSDDCGGRGKQGRRKKHIRPSARKKLGPPTRQQLAHKSNKFSTVDGVKCGSHLADSTNVSALPNGDDRWSAGNTPANGVDNFVFAKSPSFSQSDKHVHAGYLPDLQKPSTSPTEHT